MSQMGSLTVATRARATQAPELSVSITGWQVLRSLPGKNGESGSTLPLSLRRRVSAIGIAAFEAAWRLGTQEPTRFVFCSRHGEFKRTLRLLNAIVTEEELSAADFNLSVANALAGLLAIASENTAGHTAIAAGEDSFACGLLEAVTSVLIGADERVLLVYFDEGLPAEYREIGEGAEEPLALAVALAPAGSGADEIVLTPVPASERAGRRPSKSQALDFARFLETGEDVRSLGRQIGWLYRHVAQD